MWVVGVRVNCWVGARPCELKGRARQSELQVGAHPCELRGRACKSK